MRRSFFNFVMVLALPAIGTLSAAGVALAKPAEVRIVSTEFQYTPVQLRVAAGRAITLVLDNSGAETEHNLFLPALGFRLQAKAGEIARENTVFEKPGEYEFICDLPGHRDSGMMGTLIVGAF